MNPLKKTAAFLIAVPVAVALLLPAYPDMGAAQDVRTLSTGAGKDNRTLRREFSLKVVFAQRAGPFLAGVKVTIYDEAGGKVVETFSEGPWLLVALPPGKYRVVARRKSGPRAAGTVQVTGVRQKSLYLTW